MARSGAWVPRYDCFPPPTAEPTRRRKAIHRQTKQTTAESMPRLQHTPQSQPVVLVGQIDQGRGYLSNHEGREEAGEDCHNNQERVQSKELIFRHPSVRQARAVEVRSYALRQLRISVPPGNRSGQQNRREQEPRKPHTGHKDFSDTPYVRGKARICKTNRDTIFCLRPRYTEPV